MGRIIAIGGGEISELETFQIDRYIVEQVNKPNPRALFIPTASGEPEGYIETFQKVYGEMLGCQTDVLYLLTRDKSEEEIREQIVAADIIYVGGGDTAKMLSVWRRKKVNKYLKQAYENGTILTGLSAGSICWFKYGHSEISEDPIEFTRIEGLGIINAVHCPHYNEIERRENFNRMLKEVDLIGIAIEDKCAVEFHNEQYRVLKANGEAKAFKITFLNGEIEKEEIV